MKEEYNFTNSVSNPYLKNTKSKIDETEYLMSSPANAKRLLESIENIKRGKGLEMKLDDFENELLESIENNEWKSKYKDLAKRTKELQRYIKRS
jgi:uncharacterized membrane protein YgaE (UPF0421/DUF939 family)